MTDFVRDDRLQLESRNESKSRPRDKYDRTGMKHDRRLGQIDYLDLEHILAFVIDQDPPQAREFRRFARCRLLLAFAWKRREDALFLFGNFDHPVISPDGRRIAFTGVSEGGRHLWVRPIDSSAPIPLPGTDGAMLSFWSPDSKSLAFFADRKLKRIDVDEGRALTLCCDAMPVDHYYGGAWGSNGVILFSNGPVYRVRDTGGVPEPATTLDASRHERAHSVVGFLSDVRRFAFFSDPPPQPTM